MSNNLLNRSQFLAHLKIQLKQCDAENGSIGLIIVDIKKLRRINSGFGYEVGDQLLGLAGERLLEVCREKDTVGRIGSSEFAMILHGINGEGHAMLAANKIEKVLKVPFNLSDSEIMIEPTMGVSIYPEHAKGAEMLMLRAEGALLSAKKFGQLYQIFSEALYSDATFGWNIEKELDEAINNNALEVYYQPKVDLRTGKVSGVEALTRWTSPTHGVISPDVFIAIAEDIGRINVLTQWVLNTALRHALEWPKTSGELSVSVNLSAKIAHDEELAELVKSALALWCAEPQRLVIEITENELMINPDKSYSMLENLRNYGVGISIDDFGTGYSSLAYFKKLPANEIKIDKTFVMNMLEDKGDLEIVRLAIQLAHSFGFTVVAEGVETLEVMNKLASMGCDYVQGYYIAKAMPQHEFLQWLESYEPYQIASA